MPLVHLIDPSTEADSSNGRVTLSFLLRANTMLAVVAGRGSASGPEFDADVTSLVLDYVTSARSRGAYRPGLERCFGFHDIKAPATPRRPLGPGLTGKGDRVRAVPVQLYISRSVNFENFAVDHLLDARKPA